MHDYYDGVCVVHISRIAHPWSPMSIVSREIGPMRTTFEWKSSHLIGYLVESKNKFMTTDAQSAILVQVSRGQTAISAQGLID